MRCSGNIGCQVEMLEFNDGKLEISKSLMTTEVIVSVQAGESSVGFKLEQMLDVST